MSLRSLQNSLVPGPLRLSGFAVRLLAVKPDGDIVSVFAPNNSKHLNGIMHLATSVGGIKTLKSIDVLLDKKKSDSLKNHNNP